MVRKCFSGPLFNMGGKMIYENIVKANFVSRPNRFIANIEIDGKCEIAHVKNTGRCKELFVPGAEIYVQLCDNPLRKTQYDVIAVKKGTEIINIDSQIPNKVFAEFVAEGKFLSGITYVKPETTYQNSRFDFYIERGNEKIYVEVKGVTLEQNGVALFPDAPTDRGVKHINELIDAIKNGFSAYIIFVIQMKGVNEFKPNASMHKEFADALKKANENGVKIIALDCNVTENTIKIDKNIDVSL